MRLPLIVVSIISCFSNGRGGNSHHGSATKGHNEHEQPVGDQAENPHEVSKGSGETELSDLAVEGVEPAVEKLKLGLAARGLEGNQVVGGGGGHVQSLLVDVDLGRGREHLEDVEVGGGNRPGVAEDGLVVAVQESHVRSVGQNSKLASGLVEGLLNLVAAACKSC